MSRRPVVNYTAIGYEYTWLVMIMVCSDNAMFKDEMMVSDEAKKYRFTV